VHAISYADDELEFDEKICIGCGMCANVCPESAIVLVKRAKQYEPAETIFDSYKEMNKYLHDIAG
jgi:Fe-S-cluster-containing hydrogenase component 2